MKHEFLENLNNCNENTSFLYNENEFPSYPVPVGRRFDHLLQNKSNKVNYFDGFFYCNFWTFLNFLRFCHKVEIPRGVTLEIFHLINCEEKKTHGREVT